MVARQSSFELLRIASAAGIVWFHAKVPGSEVGYTGLAVFLILTPYFDLGANFTRHTPWPQQMKRLLLPFAVWSLLYAAANIVKGRPVLNLEHGWILALLAGPSIHLWYLPFMAVTQSITGILKTCLTQRAITIGGLILLLPVVIAFLMFKNRVATFGPPVGQWFHALTPVLIGLVFGASRSIYPSARALAAAALAMALLAFNDIAVLQFLAGLGLVELASKINWTSGRVNACSGYMMGVYLVHPLALTAFRPLERYSTTGFIIIAFLASTIAVAMSSHFAPSLAEALLGTPRRRPERKTNDNDTTVPRVA